MNAEAIIDFIIRKPIQKVEFNDTFNRILHQMHLQLKQVSHSMNELTWNQGLMDSNSNMKQPEMIRSTSAFIKD
jgi:hypothetical protein